MTSTAEHLVDVHLDAAALIAARLAGDDQAFWSVLSTSSADPVELALALSAVAAAVIAGLPDPPLALARIREWIVSDAVGGST